MLAVLCVSIQVPTGAQQERRGFRPSGEEVEQDKTRAGKEETNEQ